MAQIPLPPSGASTVLRVTYNKIYGVAGGVNFYPTNATLPGQSVTFIGDYSMRFQMYSGQRQRLRQCH